jgi:hypothetical protein
LDREAGDRAIMLFDLAAKPQTTIPTPATADHHLDRQAPGAKTRLIAKFHLSLNSAHIVKDTRGGIHFLRAIVNVHQRSEPTATPASGDAA